MATPITTIKVPAGHVLRLALRTLNDIRVLDETPFDTYSNYWVARITPPATNQRRDAYRGQTRPFDRRYIYAPEGFSKHRIDIKDFSYGFAYEFGGDRVGQDRRIPSRVYAIYLGTNGTGTVAEFRIYESADLAMFAERQREYPEGSPANVPPAPIRTTDTLALPLCLSSRMDALYREMCKTLHTINVLENKLKEAGYKSTAPAPDGGLMADAIADGRKYGEKAWTEKFLPVVEMEARIKEAEAEEEADKAAAAFLAANVPVVHPAPASPVAPPSSLLDAIAEEHEAVVPTPALASARPVLGETYRDQAAEVRDDELAANATSTQSRRFTKAQVTAAARAAKAPTGPRTTSEPHKVSAPAPAKPSRKPAPSVPGSFARPSTIPAPVGDDLPF